MNREEWVKNLIKKQPVYGSKDEAVKAAIQANKNPKEVYEVWKEPKERGGRYVVAESKAFETLGREKYTKILDSSRLADIERGEHIDDIEEV